MKKGMRPVYQIVKYLLLLVIGVAAMVWLIMSDHFVYLLFAVLITGFSIYKIIFLYTDSMRKVSFMFNAIDCDDYTFKFSDNLDSVNSFMLNNSLNRIKEILSNAKMRVLEREKYYELIMNSVKTGIITVNDNGNVFQVNNEAIHLLGLPIFTHINQLNPVDPALVAILRDIKPGERRQHTMRHEMGEIKLSLGASDVSYGGRNLKIISVNDINTAIDESEVESWIKLTRILTHEIMNSLAPITSLSDTLLGINHKGSPQITSGLKTIRDTGRTLISFVESYRKFTRIQKPVKSPFEIKPFLQRIVKLIAPGDFPEIRLNIVPSDTMIYADEDLVNQVFVNILKNAVQAVEARARTDVYFVGVVSVDVRIAPDESVIFHISNNGGAIPAEIAKDVFLPFFTTKEHGSGIGLSITRQIMHLHGGSIRITSNTNEKVTFTLEFP